MTTHEIKSFYENQGTSYTSVDPGSGRHDSGRQSQKWQDLCPPDLQTPADCDEIDHIPVRFDIVTTI